LSEADAGLPLRNPAQRADPADGKREAASCDYCGAPRLIWRKCKLVCEGCGNINKSCADL
jgi:hypothetical protein